MVDINLNNSNTTGHPSRRGKRTPYVVRTSVTAAEAVTAKGSALATADVIKVHNVPADTLVLAGGAEVTTADTGTTASTDVSVNAVDFVSAADLTTAAVAASVDAVAGPFAAANTVDFVLGTLTSANDDWEADIWALLLDVSAYPVVDQAKSDTFL